MHTLSVLVLSLTLATLAAGRPNWHNVHTKVVAAQTGSTRGGAFQVSHTKGKADASDVNISNAPGRQEKHTRNAIAAVTLAGASIGNGAFKQTSGVKTQSTGKKGKLATLSTSFNTGATHNALAISEQEGSSWATQQVGWPVQSKHSKLATESSVASKAASIGTGSFSGTKHVKTSAEESHNAP